MASLQHQAERCNFGSKHDRSLGDRLIIGIPSAALRERLFLERELTLAKIIETCRAAETYKLHVFSLTSSSEGIEATMAVGNLNRNHGKLARQR